MDKNVSSPLGTAPIGKLMMKMALPTVVAQIVNLLYNIVDRIYIGHIEGVGADALTGVGLCLPMIMMMNAFAMLGAAGGAGFDDDGHQQKECDDTGGLEVRADHGGKDRQRHKFIHINFAAQEVFDSGDDDGQRQDEGTADGRHIRREALFGQKTLKNKAVGSKHTADQSEKEPSHGTVVTDAAFSFVVMSANAGAVHLFVVVMMMTAAAFGIVFVLMLVFMFVTAAAGTAMFVMMFMLVAMTVLVIAFFMNVG